MALSTHEILHRLEQNAPVIRRYGVRSLGLFGSGARGTAQKDSDLDFVVEFESKSFDAYMAPAAAGARPSADPLGGLLRTGLELLTQLASAAGTGQSTEAAPSPVPERIRDERSGQSYLKIRMPEPEVMDRVGGALQALLESLRA